MRLRGRTAGADRPARAERVRLGRDGVRLAGLDYGGRGQPVLLLHGLAGYAGEWARTAGWMARDHRVVALDARGHGDSERRPEDVSLDAHVADAAHAIESLRLASAVVAGQSFGALTAILLAARRPDLVRAVVVAEATAAGGGAPAGIEAEVLHLREVLGRWPVPFPTRAAAVTWFGGPTPRAEALADGLEDRDGGWWPRWEVPVLERTLRAAVSEAHWDEWEKVERPALVVRAGHGIVRPIDAARMVERGRAARLVELPAAGHDVHLDDPDGWRAAVGEFLAGLR